jgi:phosphatidylglycerophosphate synthase
MNLANKITISRIILTPLFITAIVYSRMTLALAFFVLAVISDALDGFIARTRNEKTMLGTILIHVIKGSVNIVPSFWGKFTTFFQMMTIVAILVAFPYAAIVWQIATALTVISGADYIFKGSRVLSENNLNNKAKT